MKTVLSTLCLPLITTATLALFSAQSLAEQPPREPPSFEQLDMNGDGVLTKDEVRGPLENDFDRFDKDGSGSLTEDELPEPPNHPPRDES